MKCAEILRWVVALLVEAYLQETTSRFNHSALIRIHKTWTSTLLTESRATTLKRLTRKGHRQHQEHRYRSLKHRGILYNSLGLSNIFPIVATHGLWNNMKQYETIRFINLGWRNSPESQLGWRTRCDGVTNILRLTRFLKVFIFVQIWRMLVLGVFKMQCFLPQTKHVQVMQGGNVLNPDSSAVFFISETERSHDSEIFSRSPPFQSPAILYRTPFFVKFRELFIKKNTVTQWVNMASLNQLRLSAEFCPEVLLSVETS